MMAELSDIEEGYSSGGALGHDGEELQGKRSDDALRPENPCCGHAYDPWASIGKAKGKMFQRQRYDLQHHQSSPNSVAVVSPSLPSSPPSSRTITPTDGALPSQRSPSSGIGQIASAAASHTTLSRGESSAWSSVPRPSRSSGVTSGTASSATVSGYYHHDCNLGHQNYQQHVIRDVPPSGRLPFWWTGAASVNDLPGPDREANDEETCLVNTENCTGREMEVRWVLHAVMHGVVLALQTGVALVVLSIFAWMALWRDEGIASNGISGGLLRNMPSLTTTSVLILSSATLLIHEIYLLSVVVLLYLQAAILTLTTVSASYMWIKCVQEDNIMVKCVLISCGILLWGTSALAFLRAVVVWRATRFCEDEAAGRRRRVDGGMRGGDYATFRDSGSG